ncbi:restriction endonuclease [Micromonospora echinaurantiaca]|uniref:restriction endonuclease n=1 Tax=Micromonospora echinaurantiaca TaxID=47857 RepID=UPI00371A3166
MTRDPATAQGWAFERFVSELLSGMPDVTEVETEGGAAGDIGIDIVAQRQGRPLLVEAKSQTPQTSRRLRDVVTQLMNAAEQYRARHPGFPEPRLVIAFPGVLSPRKERPPNVELWDGGFLQREARRFGIPPPPFLALAEEEWFEEREPADDLLRRLERISPGQAEWTRYEGFCEDMLSFLFCPPLHQVCPQRTNESGVNRRDFILPNYSQDGFWSFMRMHYHADFIVAEAKNFAAPVGKSEVLQLANYLTRHGTGLVGMLLTRNGLKRDAKWTSREQWLLHDKLIIGLEDEDYRQMLLTRRTGGDPSDLIRQRIEDFRLGI